MTVTAWIGELGRQGAADAAVAVRARQLLAGCERLVLAAHWADLHAEVSGPGPAPGPGEVARSLLPGGERMRRFGGDGTPEVAEFAAAELGTYLGQSPVAAANLVADALDLRHRLPLLWCEVTEAGVWDWQAREVAKRTRAAGLSLPQARWVDEQVTPYLSSLPWSRFLALVDAKIVEADPAAAEARRVAAAMERFVATGECNEFGLRTVVAKATAGDAVFFVGMCDRIAACLAAEGDTDPVGVLRSKAVGILANPARALALLVRHAQGTSEAPVAATGAAAAGERAAADSTAAGSTTEPRSPHSSDTQPTAPAAPTATDRDGPAASARGDAGMDAEMELPLWPSDLHPCDDDSDDCDADVDCDAGVGDAAGTGPAGPVGGAGPGCALCRDTGLVGDPSAFVAALGRIDPKKLLPAVTLYLHLSRESFDAALAAQAGPAERAAHPGDVADGSGAVPGVARMEGVGPITVAQVVEFVQHTHVTCRPVIDLAEDHPVDGYEVPDRMREQLHLRSPACVFPYSGNLSRAKDVDHTAPYADPGQGGPPGQTRIANLGPLGRAAHRVKTHAHGWMHRQPVPGVHLWRTPQGYWFRVDHAGTHPLGRRPGLRALHPDAAAGSRSSPLEAAFKSLLDAA